MLSSASTIQHARNLHNMRLGCALAFNRFSCSWCTSCPCHAVLQLAMGLKLLNCPASDELSRVVISRLAGASPVSDGQGVARLHCTSTAATHTSQNESRLGHLQIAGESRQEHIRKHETLSRIFRYLPSSHLCIGCSRAGYS